MTAEINQLFVVGPPRSGVMLTGEALEVTPGVWTQTTGGRDIFEGLVPFTPDRGDRLTGVEGIDPAAARGRLLHQIRDHQDRRPDFEREDLITVVDASLYHAVRVAFLALTFPAARFLVVDRPVVDAASSAIEAWRSQRQISHPELPGWSPPRWTFPLVPGWEGLKRLPVEEVALRQWVEITNYLCDDLESLERSRWTVVRYEDLCAAPRAALRDAMSRLGLPLLPAPAEPLPMSNTTASPPRRGKWRTLNPDLIGMLAPFSAQLRRWEALVGREPGPVSGVHEDAAQSGAREQHGDARRPGRPVLVAASAAEETAGTDEVSFTVTGDLAGFLEDQATTLVASTYRSGKIIAFGAPGAELRSNTLDLNAPMGLTLNQDVLTVGTVGDVITFRNDPAAARALGPPCDACYLPRTIRFTGEMGVREVAYVGDELWAVSSKFSCLVRMAPDYSFEPRWYPPFISRLATEDRCHLNGMAVRGPAIAYVTALGETDSPGGWRDNKATGGIVVDVATGAVVIRGLSMPHSPRWHRDRLWVLESGRGDLIACDPTRGTKELVAHVPGFARGLAFIGDYAVIGLSDIRESVFRGLPIVDEPDRQCGIWIVELGTGKAVGSIRFTGVVQELFDVIAIPGVRCGVLPSLDSGLNKTSFMVPATSRIPSGNSA